GRRLKPQDNGWRWFGLKVHAREVALKADLEVHALPTGYVGLCRLKDGEVNVCGLFRRGAAARAPSLSPSDGQRGSSESANQSQRSPADTHVLRSELLRGNPGTILRARMAGAVFDSRSFCSVAGLCLRPQRATASSECRLGDSLTMIPPVTGNGMSMAFES